MVYGVYFKMFHKETGESIKLRTVFECDVNVPALSVDSQKLYFESLVTSLFNLRYLHDIDFSIIDVYPLM